MTSKADEIVRWMRVGGCDDIRASNGHAVSKCPFHKNKSGRSFAMNLSSGLYICYNSDCGASGNFARFLVEACSMDWKSAIENAAMLGSNKAYGEDFILPSYENRRQSEKLSSSALVERAVKVYSMCPEYLVKKRGFKKSVLREWEIGYDKESKSVVIPVRDELGHAVGLSKRATVAGGAKYLHLGFQKSKVVYGFHRACSSVIYVCEGQLDAIAVYQMLGASAVSTMGSKVSKRQIRILSYLPELVLCKDMDSAGDEWTVTIGEGLIQLGYTGRVSVVMYYEGGVKDPAALLKDVGNMRESETEPYEVWRLRHFAEGRK